MKWNNTRSSGKTLAVAPLVYSHTTPIQHSYCKLYISNIA